MPDVREVYDMVTQQTPPKPDALERQRKRQMRHTMTRRLGGFAAAAAVIGLAVFLTIRASIGDGAERPAKPADTGPSVSAPRVPSVDYVIDLRTGEMTPLPEPIIRSTGGTFNPGQYAVSPDGSLLAYVGISGGDQIFIAGIDGTGVRQVTHRRNGARSPAWSPDGTRIAYEGLDSEHVRSLFVLDVASGESTQILTFGSPVRSGPGPLPGLEPQFTPDGSSLLYSAGSYEQPVLRIVPVAGGKSSIFIGPGGGLAGAGNGSLSPDGSLVTFLGSEAGGPGPGRWVANADGTERRHLPDVYGLPCVANPAGTWSSDGSRIVCSEASSVIVVDVATGEASPVAIGREATWLDDHTLLVEL